MVFLIFLLCRIIKKYNKCDTARADNATADQKLQNFF